MSAIIIQFSDPVSKSNRVAPIFTGPADTGSLHVKTFFVQEVCRKDVLGDCLNFTVQLPKKRNVSEGLHCPPRCIIIIIVLFFSFVHTLLVHLNIITNSPSIELVDYIDFTIS